MFYKKVIRYCNENKLSVMGFEIMCDLANGTVSKWKNGGNPSLTTLMKIANATHIPIKEWVE